MKLGVVVGQVVSTVKQPGFEQERLLLVDVLNNSGQPSEERIVVTDSLGAGNGEWVLVASGSAARKAVRSINGIEAPVDACIVGIVDEVVVNGDIFYHK